MELRVNNINSPQLLSGSIRLEIKGLLVRDSLEALCCVDP